MKNLAFLIASAMLVLTSASGIAQQEPSPQQDERHSSSIGPHFSAASIAKLERMADEGDVEAQYELGFVRLFSEESGEQAAGLALFRLAAERGHAQAQSALGRIYALGQYGVERDYWKAARLCGLAAERDDSDGQLCLGLLYANGAGVEQNDEQAVSWLIAAGLNGQGMAQALLGDMHASGAHSLPIDSEEAERWYAWAADPQDNFDPDTVIAGVTFSSGRNIMHHLLRVGEMYREGVVLAKNDVLAYKWLYIAQNWGSGWTRPTDDGEMVSIQPEIDAFAATMTAEHLQQAIEDGERFLEKYRR